jgi:hypothetical protein
MKFKFPYNGYHSEDLIRQCGYGRIFNSRTEEISYQRALGASGYPRFHAYLEDHDDYFEVSLHLDQSKAVYEGMTAHAGDYDSEVVVEEAQRITATIARIFGVEI